MGLVDRLVTAARGDFEACSHWPPSADTFECRSECKYRRTCEAYRALVQAGHVILVTVYKDKEAMGKAIEVEEVKARSFVQGHERPGIVCQEFKPGTPGDGGCLGSGLPECDHCADLAPEEDQ